MSSNRTVARLIEGIVGEENERRGGAGGGGLGGGVSGGGGVDGEGVSAHGENEDEEIVHGPEIWLCSTARSLIGKERQRRA